MPKISTGAKAEAEGATEETGAVPSRELGHGWKVSPSIDISVHGMATLAEIQGSGAIHHMWMTIHPDKWRRMVIRIFWNGEEHPAVEVPLGDCSKAALGLANSKPDDFHYD